jgi:ATP-dependent helicase/nuclease subunit A
VSSTPLWTESQLQAIRTTGGTLLVSAAAGSGKTAVLAERCVYLTCDAPDRCDVDRLLVVTFTRAAAAEMRSRIGRALRSRLASSRDEVASAHVARQLRLLDQADITTLDSFCVGVCRQTFDRLGIDPRFVVLDPVEARLMRRDLAERAIDAALADHAALRELININFNGRLGELAGAVLDAHSLMGAQADGHAWLGLAVERIEQSSRDPAKARELMQPLADLVSVRLERVELELKTLLDEASSTASASKHAHTIAMRLDACAQIRAGFDASDRTLLDAGVKQFRDARAPNTVANHPAKGLSERMKTSKARVDAVLKSPLLTWTLDELMRSQANILPRVRAFADVVGRFDQAYRLAKQSLQAMDFADVEASALRALCDDLSTLTPSASAVALSERYAHVLVDEYQDINPLQDAILKLVSTRRRSQAPGGPVSNLFCVGDVKQSIYSFRLAEPGQFIALADELGAAREGFGGRVDLQANFRSRSQILDAANFVFERLFDRDLGGIVYDATHRLHVGASYPPAAAGPMVELQLVVEGGEDPEDAPDDENDELDRLEREGTLLARAIRDMVAPQAGEPVHVCERTPDGLVPRPARFGDIAVLLRARRQRTLRLASVLRREGIPVTANDPTGFFDQVEVLDVLSLLQVLDNASQDIALAAVLRAPWAGEGNRDDLLAEIRLDSPGVSFHEAVRRFAASSHPEAMQVRCVCDKLDRWRQSFREEPLDEALDRVVDESGLGLFVEGLSDPGQRQANLDALRAIARRVAASDRPTLSRLVASLDDLRDADDTATPPGAASDNAVTVLSIHGSKGLEFPIVFVVEVGKKFNAQDLRKSLTMDRHAGIGLHAIDVGHPARWPSLALMTVSESIRGKFLSEELRTLYVALTRARERLVLIGSATRKQIDGWREQSGDSSSTMHAGFRQASTALHWLVPILTQPQAAPLVRVTEVPAQSIVSRPRRGASQVEGTTVCESNDGGYLEFSYPYAEQTLERATRAVTSLKHKVEIVRPRPRRPDDVEGHVLGDIVHRVLERLDYTRAQSVEMIDRQIQEMIDAGHLLDQEAQRVDRESIVWLASTSLGERLRAPVAELRRELAISALQNRTLLRGRIDLLLLEPGRATVIDFKSDRVDSTGVARLTAIYTPQLAAYLDVLGRMVPGREVSGLFAFLTPRMLVTVNR